MNKPTNLFDTVPDAAGDTRQRAPLVPPGLVRRPLASNIPANFAMAYGPPPSVAPAAPGPHMVTLPDQATMAAFEEFLRSREPAVPIPGTSPPGNTLPASFSDPFAENHGTLPARFDDPFIDFSPSQTADYTQPFAEEDGGFPPGTIDPNIVAPPYALRTNLTPNKQLGDGDGLSAVRATHQMRQKKMTLSKEEQSAVDMTVSGLTEADLEPLAPSDDEGAKALPGARPHVAKANTKTRTHVASAANPTTPGRGRAASLLPPSTPKVKVMARAGSEAVHPAVPDMAVPTATDGTRGTANPPSPNNQGRLTIAEEEVLAETATQIYAQIHELAYELRRSPDLIINRLNQLTGSKVATKKTLWNYYQSYFSRHRDVEHARLGTQEPSKPTTKHLNAFIRYFTDEVGPNWAEFLILEYDLHHVDAPTTVGESERTFRSLSTSVSNLLDDYEKRHHIQALVVMCGTSVNEDQANGIVHVTEGMQGFVEKRLCMSEDALLGHAKTHSFDHFSLLHAQQAATERDRTSGATPPPDAHVDNPTRTTTVGISHNDLIHGIAEFVNMGADYSKMLSDLKTFVSISLDGVKKMHRDVARLYLKAFMEAHMYVMGMPLKASKLSWQSTPKQFASHGVAVIGWPTGVPFPPQAQDEALQHYGVRDARSHQGMRAYKTDATRALLLAFRERTIGLRRRVTSDLVHSIVPVFQEVVPPTDPKVAARCLYVDGRVEELPLKSAPTKTTSSSSKQDGSAGAMAAPATAAPQDPAPTTRAKGRKGAAPTKTKKGRKAAPIVESIPVPGSDARVPFIDNNEDGTFEPSESEAQETPQVATRKMPVYVVEDDEDRDDEDRAVSPSPVGKKTVPAAPLAHPAPKPPARRRGKQRVPTPPVEEFDDSDMFLPDSDDPDAQITKEIDELLPSSPLPAPVTAKPKPRPIVSAKSISTANAQAAPTTSLLTATKPAALAVGHGTAPAPTLSTANPSVPATVEETDHSLRKRKSDVDRRRDNEEPASVHRRLDVDGNFSLRRSAGASLPTFQPSTDAFISSAAAHGSAFGARRGQGPSVPSVPGPSVPSVSQEVPQRTGGHESAGPRVQVSQKDWEAYMAFCAARDANGGGVGPSGARAV